MREPKRTNRTRQDNPNRYAESNRNRSGNDRYDSGQQRIRCLCPYVRHVVAATGPTRENSRIGQRRTMIPKNGARQNAPHAGRKNGRVQNFFSAATEYFPSQGNHQGHQNTHGSPTRPCAIGNNTEATSAQRSCYQRCSSRRALFPCHGKASFIYSLHIIAVLKPASTSGIRTSYQYPVSSR